MFVEDGVHMLAGLDSRDSMSMLHYSKQVRSVNMVPDYASYHGFSGARMEVLLISPKIGRNQTLRCG